MNEIIFTITKIIVFVYAMYLYTFENDKTNALLILLVMATIEN